MQSAARLASPHGAGRLPPRAVLVRSAWKWSYANCRFDVPFEVESENDVDVVALPALNLASTRRELRPLARRLAPEVTSVICDWPGFGETSRLDVPYTPELLLDFVVAFVSNVVKRKGIGVVASGHAGSYVLKLASRDPALFSRIALVSPTYKSPAAAMGMRPWVAAALRAAFRGPLGETLYRGVIRPEFLKKQYASHVFRYARHITEAFLRERREVVDRPGGRLAPAAFFTGQLDVIHSHDEFLSLAEAVDCPLKIVYGKDSPAASLQTMQALERSARLDVVATDGSLGLAEEFPDAVAQILRPFLSQKGL